MSVQSQISRLEGLRNTIRTKLEALGLASGSDDLDTLATALNSVTDRGAATITPGTSDQSIAAGQYLSGAQIIKGDANLVSENIAEGVSIFGVLGTKAAGTQIATGTVTLSATLLTECTVDGLGFTPSRVVIIALDTYKYSGNSTAQVLITVDTSIASGDAGLSSPIYSWVTYSSSSGMAPFKVTVTNGQDMVKFTDGGFIIDTSTIKTNPYSGSTTYSGALKLPRYFKYIAIE